MSQAAVTMSLTVDASPLIDTAWATRCALEPTPIWDRLVSELGAEDLLAGIGELEPRSCEVCGCTDEHACDGGCAWSTRNPEMCTACEDHLDEIVEACEASEGA